MALASGVAVADLYLTSRRLMKSPKGINSSVPAA